MTDFTIPVLIIIGMAIVHIRMNRRERQNRERRVAHYHKVLKGAGA